MTRVGGAIIGLRLAPQDRLHDLGQPVVLRKSIDQAVKHRRGDHLPEREALLEGFEIILEAHELLAARRFVDAVHHRRFLRLERLRRRDVRRDHIILDQPHRIEPIADANFRDASLLVENDLTFGQVEIERRAGGASLCEERPARPKIFERREHIGVPLLARRVGVIGRLRMFIGDVRAQPHQRAGETP